MTNDRNQSSIMCRGLGILLGEIPELAARMHEERREQIIRAISATVRKIVSGPLAPHGEALKTHFSSDVDLALLGLAFDECIEIANGHLVALLIDKNIHFSFFDFLNPSDDDPTSPKPSRKSHKLGPTPFEFVRALDRMLQDELSPKEDRIINFTFTVTANGQDIDFLVSAPASTEIFAHCLTEDGIHFARLQGEKVQDFLFTVIEIEAEYSVDTRATVDFNSSFRIVEGTHSLVSLTELLNHHEHLIHRGDTLLRRPILRTYLHELMHVNLSHLSNQYIFLKAPAQENLLYELIHASLPQDLPNMPIHFAVSHGPICGSRSYLLMDTSLSLEPVHGTDILNSGDFNDTISAGNDTLISGDSNDTIIGGAGSHMLIGGGDIIDGGGDIIDGGGDIIDGGGGNDTLIGRASNDTGTITLIGTIDRCEVPFDTVSFKSSPAAANVIPGSSTLSRELAYSTHSYMPTHAPLLHEPRDLFEIAMRSRVNGDEYDYRNNEAALDGFEAAGISSPIWTSCSGRIANTPLNLR